MASIRSHVGDWELRTQFFSPRVSLPCSWLPDTVPRQVGRGPYVWVDLVTCFGQQKWWRASFEPRPQESTCPAWPSPQSRERAQAGLLEDGAHAQQRWVTHHPGAPADTEYVIIQRPPSWPLSGKSNKCICVCHWASAALLYAAIV